MRCSGCRCNMVVIVRSYETTEELTHESQLLYLCPDLVWDDIQGVVIKCSNVEYVCTRMTGKNANIVKNCS